jgi:hypothetical protein
MWSLMAAAVPIIKRKDKQYSNDKEYMGKEFLINSLTSLAWKMEAETRGAYLLQSHS